MVQQAVPSAHCSEAGQVSMKLERFRQWHTQCRYSEFCSPFHA